MDASGILSAGRRLLVNMAIEVAKRVTIMI